MVKIETCPTASGLEYAVSLYAKHANPSHTDPANSETEESSSTTFARRAN